MQHDTVKQQKNRQDVEKKDEKETLKRFLGFPDEKRQSSSSLSSYAEVRSEEKSGDKRQASSG